MLEHSIAMIPLNSGFDTGTVVTFDPAAHAAATTCSILCTDPMSSYFKMRSGSTRPSLEPAFFGLNVGDEVILEFDALVTSGTATRLYASFRSITGGVGSGIALTQMLPADALAGYFKPFRIPFVVREQIAEGEGVLVNVSFDDSNAEVVLRDVVARVRTSNSKFALRNRIVGLTRQADYAKSISLVQRSPINPALGGARQLLTDGNITFPDRDTAAFAWPVGTARWAGFASYLPACEYPQPIHVYYEVCDPSGASTTPGEWTRPVGGDLIERESEQGGVQHPPTDGAWRPRFRVFKGVPGDKRLVRVNVGGNLENATTRLRNVYFSLPRFDDVPDDRRPNELDEMFPDLGAIISP